MSRHATSYVLQPEVMVFFLQCLRQNSFTCRLGKCGGHASFARWIFKFISRIRIVVVVVVIFVINLGGLDVRIHAKKKKMKAFFGLEYLGSFFGGIISICFLFSSFCFHLSGQNANECILARKMKTEVKV